MAQKSPKQKTQYQIDQEQLEATLYYRRECRRNYSAWCNHALKPVKQRPARHHRFVINEIQETLDEYELALKKREEYDRLCLEYENDPDQLDIILKEKGLPYDSIHDRKIINMNPGVGKSTYVTKLLPGHFAARFPNSLIIVCSYTAYLADQMSADAKRYIEDNPLELGFTIKDGFNTASAWTSTNDVNYRAVGVGGSVTGFRADLIIIDDPIKGRADAESATIREATKKFYANDLRSRLKPNGIIIIINTRWHIDDLAGYVMNIEPERWKLINMPAYAEENDILGRKPGELIWPEWQTAREVEEQRKYLGERDFNSLFQQRPVALEGNMFMSHKMEKVGAVPPGCKFIRAWDFAASDLGDWTVGVLLAKTPQKTYIVVDVQRIRGKPEVVMKLLRDVAYADRERFNNINVRIPQDPGQAGVAQVTYIGKELAGFNIIPKTNRGDKATRAYGAASAVNIGLVSIVAGSWNDLFITELASFPAAPNDDQVDAFVDAFNELVEQKQVPRFLSANVFGR